MDAFAIEQYGRLGIGDEEIEATELLRIRPQRRQRCRRVGLRRFVWLKKVTRMPLFAT
jgi:hypothetical protein